MWDPHAENYKILLSRKTEGERKNYIRLMDWGYNIIKMSILPKSMKSFNAIPIKIPAKCFVDIYKLIQKFIWKCKGTSLAQTIIRKNKDGKCLLPNFKTGD